jgi:hypothetical protein
MPRNPTLPSEFIAVGNGNIQDIGWLSWFPKISGEGIPFQVVFVLLPLSIVVTDEPPRCNRRDPSLPSLSRIAGIADRLSEIF